METTPAALVESVVLSVCGRRVERLVRITRGGLNETYRVEFADAASVIVRIGRRPTPWFTNEGPAMLQAREVGVPVPDVIGVEHVENEGELLSFSVLSIVPGHSLEEMVDELAASELERLVTDGGELLARLHSAAAAQGTPHKFTAPDEQLIDRVVSVAHEAFGSPAAVAVERGARLLCDEVTNRSAPAAALSHGDWLPKHLLIEDGAITGVIDWEFAGAASPALDLAHWELSAGDHFHGQSDLLRRGYERIADPDVAASGWVPAFAINFALEKLAWQNPAPLPQLQRCVEIITRHTQQA